MIPKFLFESIDQRWHTALLRLLETGEADQDLLDFIDSDENCQRVIEEAFAFQSQNIEGFARMLKDTPGFAAFAEPPGITEDDAFVKRIAGILTEVLKIALALDQSKRRHFVQDAIGDLLRSLNAGQKEVLWSVIEDMDVAARGSDFVAARRA